MQYQSLCQNPQRGGWRAPAPNQGEWRATILLATTRLDILAKAFNFEQPLRRSDIERTRHAHLKVAESFTEFTSPIDLTAMRLRSFRNQLMRKASPYAPHPCP